MMDLGTTLRQLAQERPLFHSEADFQHALAWRIHESQPDIKVRLEYRPARLASRIYVDIWLEHRDQVCAIELKYKTRRCGITCDGESFDLKDQGAHDVARYDVCKDIARIEQLAEAYSGLTGYVVFLTNDPQYWREAKRADTIDAAFQLHEGIVLSGSLSWLEHASAGSTKGRDAPICLRGEFPVVWDDYSRVEGAGAHFRSTSFTVAS